MSVDLLRVEANERVDLLDFQQLANSSMEEALRVQGNTFLTNPLATFRSFILDGFALSNPSGKQLTVTKGRGLLARRVGGTVKYGILTSEGDATKTIDLAAMAATTYNVYIRFEFIDGDSSSRIFWDATGTGKEFAQTMSTKLKANWSLRVETGSPGSEWLQIGTVNNAGVSLVIVDQRPFYFEGLPSATYASGWSAYGGGSPNDRDPDRATYGVKDLQTFTAAMRQCLEDIKGRGLRRWWDRDIGGMNIGFDDAPVEDRLAIGDANMYLQWSATFPELRMDSGGDSLIYDRANNRWQFKIANVEEMHLDTSGLEIAHGLTSTGSASHTSGGVFTGFVGGGSGLQVFAGATAGWSTGIVSTGAGTGPGGYFVGGILAGESGHGAIGLGGNAGGVGFWGRGGGAIGAEGIYGEGSPLGGSGVKGVGKLTGAGGYFEGGFNGYGIQSFGGAGGGFGVWGLGSGAYSGVYGSYPGIGGIGVTGSGGSASGCGVSGVASFTGNSNGVEGYGGGTGAGVYGKGRNGGIGVSGEGYPSGDGYGVKGLGYGDGFGVWAVKSNGVGDALYADASAGTGYGASVAGKADPTTNGRAALRISPQSGEPFYKDKGAIYYHNTNNKLYFYNGTTWKEIAVV